MGKKEIEKEAIIAEYLVGESSYKKLRIKYGVDSRNVHLWVMK
jgi:transposase-like protein